MRLFSLMTALVCLSATAAYAQPVPSDIPAPAPVSDEELNKAAEGLTDADVQNELVRVRSESDSLTPEQRAEARRILEEHLKGLPAADQEAIRKAHPLLNNQ